MDLPDSFLPGWMYLDIFRHDPNMERGSWKEKAKSRMVPRGKRRGREGRSWVSMENLGSVHTARLWGMWISFAGLGAEFPRRTIPFADLWLLKPRLSVGAAGKWRAWRNLLSPWAAGDDAMEPWVVWWVSRFNRVALGVVHLYESRQTSVVAKGDAQHSHHNVAI